MSKFACPECGSKLCVLFIDFWKCNNGHETRHLLEERKRLVRISNAKRKDYLAAEWRPLDYQARRASHDQRNDRSDEE